MTLAEVAQDGMRVRASAGRGSFRRKARLEECLEAAQARVEGLAQEREHPDTGISRRERAARERAAQERADRVEEALRQLPEVQAVKERQKRHAGKKRAAKVTEARVSTTDPDARVMKMPGEDFRPAYNVHFATDVGSQVIVGVGVINRGTDQGEGLVMEAQVAQRTGQHPGAYLLDGGFVDLKDIEALEGCGVWVYAPPKKRKKGQEAIRKRGAKPGEIAWRERMETEEGQAIYRHRASTAGMCQCSVPNEVRSATFQRAWCDQRQRRSPPLGRYPQPVALGRADWLKLPGYQTPRHGLRQQRAPTPQRNRHPIAL